MLEVNSIYVNYGAVSAVADVSLAVGPGKVGVLLGANGAGKSSVLGAISGLAPLSQGSILFNGERLDSIKCYRRKGLGIAHALEGHRVLGELTVQENLLLGALGPGRHRIDRRALDAALAREYERFPVLGERRKQRARLLSGGEQQMLTISSALMSQPRLLLLDEPSLGLSPKIASLIFTTIGELAAEGLSILLVEQTIDRALAIADFVWVMRQGRIVDSGTPANLTSSVDLGALYLGSAVSNAPAHAHADRRTS